MFHVKHILSEDQIFRFQKACSTFLKTQNSCKIGIPREMLEKFQIYLNQILDWNKRIHLVSNYDANPERILRHFVDSLTVFKAIQIPHQTDLLDLGAGPGFPSIPIKIIRDDLSLSLVESIRKKGLFLQKLIKDLKLKDVSVVNKRAEDLMDAFNYKEKFDIVTAKALGRLKNTIGLSAYFLKKKGLLIAYKGEKVEEEIRNIEEKNFLIRKKILVKIPDFDLKRTIVVVEKIGSTVNGLNG
ncbi:MAG: 16S rRNA (guanine(527)-N(7))-methyltransferase RsmG [Candidatus Zixiibacteriota bacterium]